MSQSKSYRWCEYEGVGRFMVASVEDPEYQAALYGGRAALGLIGLSLSEEQEANFQYNLFSKYILLGWDGEIVSSSGERVAYSPAWARHLISTKIDFFMWLIDMAKKG